MTEELCVVCEQPEVSRYRAPEDAAFLCSRCVQRLLQAKEQVKNVIRYFQVACNRGDNHQDIAKDMPPESV